MIYIFQASPLDLVHDQAQGWDVDDWGEPDNAANWFENVPNNPPPPLAMFVSPRLLFFNESLALDCPLSLSLECPVPPW